VGVGVVVGLVIGLVVGVVLGWLWAARRTNEQVQAAATDLARAQAELEAERRILEARRADQEALERFVQGPLADTTQRVLLQVGGSLRAENDLLLRQAQQVGASELDARRQAIEGLIGPLRAELERLQGEVRALETKREGAYAQLREQMQQLTESEARLAQTAGELVQALRRPTTRGRWGELQLRRVVELAGMTSYCDFTEQPSSTTDDGSRQRPDLVVRLPGEAEVVVDAKVPLEAYLQGLEAPDETARKEALARHARQLREHVHTLATKAYWSQRPRTPELVVAFVPGDALLAAALEADPALLDDAIASHVLLATPVTLIALLKAVAYGWRQEALAESAQQVANLGRDLHRRLVTFAEHLAKVGKGLDGATRAYNAAVGSFESRVLPAARRFDDLGALGQSDQALGELPRVETAPRDPVERGDSHWGSPPDR